LTKSLQSFQQNTPHKISETRVGDPSVDLHVSRFNSALIIGVNTFFRPVRSAERYFTTARFAVKW
jgi:hypothetical protein